jgi:hypothetical protein
MGCGPAGTARCGGHFGQSGDERIQGRGFCLLAELALTLVRSQTGQSMDDLVREMTLLMADAAITGPPREDAAG